MNRYVIIGASIAGLEAAATILEKDVEARVDLFDSESEIPYYRPQLTKIIDSLATLRPIKPKSFFSTPGLHFHPESLVKLVDPLEKRIVSNGKYYPYDKLIFCCGADSSTPTVANPKNARIFTIRSYNDVQNLHIATKNRQRGAVIGGSALGLEIAESLTRMGLQITVYDIFPRLLGRVTDEESARVLQEFLTNHGIFFQIGRPVSIPDANHVAAYGEPPRPCDVIVGAAGITPRIRLAANAGVNVDKGILVNSSMETSVTSIYAAGDCCQINDKLCGLWLSAADQGRIAGANATGEKLSYIPKPSRMMLSLFGKTIMALGKTSVSTNQERAISQQNQNSYLRLYTTAGRCTGIFFIGNSQEAAQIPGMLGRTVESNSST